jgi:hypothetical protein
MEVQQQGVPVDPIAAFETFQQYHGMEMGRMAGELVRINTFANQLQKENQALQERITAMEQNQVAAKEPNGAHPSGADLKEYPLQERITAMEQNQVAAKEPNGAHPSGADLKEYPLPKAVKKQV